ncbi:MAG TPA: HAD family phosphatase [Verrucomicrobiae bacterium]|nr:HAD family phosphatase [Verrucomicrobiae bacterium]
MRQRAGRVAFDLDGVIWNSDFSHFEAVNIALAPYGERITEEEHQTTFKGLPTKRKLAMLTEMGRLPVSAHADVERRKKDATLQTIESVMPRPEVTMLLLALRAAEWQICCCSNSIRDTVQAVMLKMNLLDLMDFTLSNEDVDRAKPAPDIYTKAARIWHIQPEHMVVVEDGEAGKQAARQAGCHLIEVAGPEEVEPWLIHRILEAGRTTTYVHDHTMLPVLA